MLKRLTFSLLSMMVTSLYLTTPEPGNAQQLHSANPGQASGSVNAAPKALSQFVRQGTQLSLNGRTLPIAWSQWRQGQSVITGISDTGLMQAIGLELLPTTNYTKQPVRWFSRSTQPLVVTAKLGGAYRYLDANALARTAGWKLQVDGNTLRITSPSARVQNIQSDSPALGTLESTALLPKRIVVDLDRPTSWQANDSRTESVITLDALVAPTIVERFTPPPPPPAPLPVEQPSLIPPVDVVPTPSPVPTPTPQLLSPIVQSSANQTTIRVNIPNGWRSRVTPVPNSNRLIITLAPDAVTSQDITWAPGVRWRQQFVNLGTSRFPVTWLEVNPRQPGLSIRPILSNPTTLVGITPLVQMSRLSQASAAINAGFFNRNNQYPLGAIRSNGKWLSSPILNRGAIAWNDKGNFKIGNLAFQETVTTATGERLPILYFNSGYVQSGISRYTSEWGATYTPLTDNEIIVTVQRNQVTSLTPSGLASKTPFPIPTDGYLLTVRGNPESANLLTVGNTLRLESGTTPVDFNQYPYILSAGPVLVQNRQVVLDAKAERFSDAFIKEAAIRSAIATTPSGNLIIAAVHNRAGGSGPTLAELAEIMQQMGVVDALNFDGGSSTSLALGGQLINRAPATAARVHNGLGIFLK